MMIQWHAGLRVSGALALEMGDLSLDYGDLSYFVALSSPRVGVEPAR